MKVRIPILFLSFLAVVILSGCPNYSPPPNDWNNSITVYNDSPTIIIGIFITGCSDDYWGPNQISYELWPGDYVSIVGIRDGCYDLLAENEYGEIWEIYNMYINGGYDYEIFLD